MLETAGAILSFDAFYGDDHGPNVPASFTIRLYDVDDVELDNATNAPGYAALSGVTNNSTNFPPADVDGSKTSAEITVCTATGTWDAAPAWVGVCDGATRLERVPYSSGGVPVAGKPVTVTLELGYEG